MACAACASSTAPRTPRSACWPAAATICGAPPACSFRWRGRHEGAGCRNTGAGIDDCGADKRAPGRGAGLRNAARGLPNRQLAPNWASKKAPSANHTQLHPPCKALSMGEVAPKGRVRVAAPASRKEK